MTLALASLCGAGEVATADATANDLSSAKEQMEAASKTLGKLDNAFRVAAKDRKRLTRYERIAVSDARKSVYAKSAEGKTLASSLHTAAELLRSAAKGKTVEATKAKRYGELATALEAMTRRLAPKATASMDATERNKRAATLLKTWDDVMSKPRTDDFAKCWKMLAEGDPRQRVVSAGIEATMALLGDCKSSCSEGDAAKAATLLANIADRFQEVPTVRRKKVNLDTAPPST